VLVLTSPLKRTDVIEEYCIEQELSQAKRAQLLRIAAGTVPWFVALCLTISYVSTLVLASTPPVAVLRPGLRRRNAELEGVQPPQPSVAVCGARWVDGPH
jgi:hypothetical protein